MLVSLCVDERFSYIAASILDATIDSGSVIGTNVVVFASFEDANRLFQDTQKNFCANLAENG